MIRSVIFDLDNTLYSYDRAHSFAYRVVKEYAVRTFNWTAIEFDKRHHDAQQELLSYMGDVAAVHNRVIRYQRMIEKAGLPIYPYVLDMNDLYWGTFISVAEPHPGAIEALEFIKSKGLSVGIGTNMTVIQQFQKLTKLEMLKYVDFVVSSEETGAEKPDTRLFERCAEKAGCPISECLMIGDSIQHDMSGAVRSGMKFLWFRLPSDVKEMDEKGVAREKYYSDGSFSRIPILYSFAELPEVMEENGFI